MREEAASALSCSHSGMGTAQGPPLSSRSGLAEVPHADALRIDAAGAKVQEEPAHYAFLQTPCRTMCCSRTVPNALFILFFFLFKHRSIF